MKIFVDENLTVDEALLLEPELRPEFVEKMGGREKEPIVQITDFRRYFELEENV